MLVQAKVIRKRHDARGGWSRRGLREYRPRPQWPAALAGPPRYSTVTRGARCADLVHPVGPRPAWSTERRKAAHRAEGGSREPVASQRPSVAFFSNGSCVRGTQGPRIH